MAGRQVRDLSTPTTTPVDRDSVYVHACAPDASRESRYSTIFRLDQQQVTVERGRSLCVALRSAKGDFHMAPQHVTTETHNLNHAGQPADGAIEGAAAIRLDLGPNFGLSGPSVGGAVWPIFLRDHTAMDAPCAIARASWDLRLSEFSVNGTGWHSVALRFVASSRSVMRYVKEVF